MNALEDSYIGFADLFCVFSGKSLEILMHLGIHALFEFNWNSSAEIYVNSSLIYRY